MCGAVLCLCDRISPALNRGERYGQSWCTSWLEGAENIDFRFKGNRFEYLRAIVFQ
ncbi:MAG: hypothetical protein ABI180_10940 [Microcoleus sp.]